MPRTAKEQNDQWNRDHNEEMLKANSPPAVCEVCNKKFDTAAECIKHSREAHFSNKPSTELVKQPPKFKITANKKGMSYKTPYDNQDTEDGVKEAVGILLEKGFTYITISKSVRRDSDGLTYPGGIG